VSETGARRAYRRLLRLAPARVREPHAGEMEELFLARWQAARERGRRARAALWLRAGLDLLAARVDERRRLFRSRSARTGRIAARRPPMTASDVRYAVRSLLGQKGAAGLVVTMLALGIAANVAVFGLVNGLFLRPFPFPEPERLVYINEKAPRWDLEYVGINYPDLHHWREEQRLFQAIAYFDSAGFNVAGDRDAERIVGGRVTYDLPAVLGLAPALGRFFSADEDRPGGPPVVVLGHGLWQERFGGARDVVGRSLKLDGVPRTVVGVMPPEADFPAGARFWVPLAGDPSQEVRSYSGEGIGRLKPGVSVAQAEADLLRAQQAIWDARDPERVVSPFVRGLREERVRDFRTQASALAVAVGLLLVVACANVASLMLARALARRREIAIRVAVGASRLRLLAQLLVENLMLAALGGGLGLLVGWWALKGLLAAVPDDVPRWAAFGLDGRVMAFALAVTSVTVVLFGWAPAFHALRGDVRQAMSNAAAGTTASPRGRRTLRLLVGTEFALAGLLLVCGGLLLQAFDRVRQVSPGFDPRGVLAFGVYLPQAAYPDSAKRLVFWDRLLERLRSLPGVEAAGAITCPPLGCHWGAFYSVEGQAPRAKGERNPVVLQRWASVDYFQALGIRLKAGRLFDARDGRPGSGRSVIVNEEFAREFFRDGRHPVGGWLRQGGDASDNQNPWVEVIGVVEDVKHYGLERPMRPGLYFPLPRRPADSLTIALKTRVQPTSLAAAARAAVRELDPDLAVYQVRTMEEALRRSLTTRSAYSWMLAVFALLALLLALGGTYGVTAYLATQRTREIGIRLALGARSADIRRSVLRGSLAVVAGGAVAGLVGSLAAARGLASLLFGVPPHDPRVLLGAGAVLAASALLASWLPAARAARVDPMSTLRAE
jgi:putative ABC transport system permease protein